MTHTPRFFYALGPGDAVDSYQKWKAGVDFVAGPQLTFSGQFFDFCTGHQAIGYAVSSHPACAIVREGSLIVENRPKPIKNPRGPVYHANQILYGIGLMLSAIRFNTDVMIVDSGTTHWFVLSLLKLTHIRVITCIHNVYWPAGKMPSGLLKRLIRVLDGLFWSHCAKATLSISPEGQRQVETLAHRRNGPVFPYRSQYHREVFKPAPPPSHDIRPFRILYMGRVERDKGVFDTLEIAERLNQEYPGQFQFKIGGGGNALEELRHTIKERNLSGFVEATGLLSRDDLIEAYVKTHVVIIPTQSSFCEGMPAVAAEAVLIGRPIVTSRISNALDVLKGAIVEAEPDDILSYVNAISRLYLDPAFYQICCDACPPLRDQFYDRNCGWIVALERAVQSFEPTLLSNVAIG